MQRTLSLAFKLPKLFRFHKTPDVLTLFHSPTSESSNRILGFLKSAQHSPNIPSPPSPTTTATATTTTPAGLPVRFELDVIQAPTLPTSSQYRSIIDFLGGGEIHARKVLKGVSSVDEGARMLAENEGEREGKGGGDGGGGGGAPVVEKGMLHIELARPIVVDWNNGRVVVGDNEEEVRRLVETLPTE